MPVFNSSFFTKSCPTPQNWDEWFVFELDAVHIYRTMTRTNCFFVVCACESSQYPKQRSIEGVIKRGIPFKQNQNSWYHSLDRKYMSQKKWHISMDDGPSFFSNVRHWGFKLRHDYKSQLFRQSYSLPLPFFFRTFFILFFPSTLKHQTANDHDHDKRRMTTNKR
jgi:hypothetical protein